VCPLCWGDFNLIRCQADKNNRNINWRLVNMFNEFIVEQRLQELRRSRSNPVLANLERILISPEWGQKFP
jgi:hypothetical protein